MTLFDPSFFLFVSESSGDMLGAKLIEALRKKSITKNFWGVGGPEMRYKGLQAFAKMEDFQVMGFIEVLMDLPRLYSLSLKIIEQIIKKNPEKVIFIDSPAFSLRAGKKLREKGYKGKIIQIVAPTVWAWDKKRIDTMNAYLDLLLVIYPFEKPFFEGTSFKTFYIGHPILEILEEHVPDKNWEEKLFIPFHLFKDTISLFPGSRPSEIKNNLPIMLQTIDLLKGKRVSILCLIICAHVDLMETLYTEIRKSHLKLGQNCFIIPKTYTYETMQKSTLAIAKSGTVTLELGLQGVPSIVMYHTSFFNRFIAKFWFKVNLSFYCITNILLEKEVFPEFIENVPTAKKIADKAVDMLKNKDLKENFQEIKKELISLFSEEKASEKAAIAILELV